MRCTIGDGTGCGLEATGFVFKEAEGLFKVSEACAATQAQFQIRSDITQGGSGHIGGTALDGMGFVDQAFVVPVSRARVMLSIRVCSSCRNISATNP